MNNRRITNILCFLVVFAFGILPNLKYALFQQLFKAAENTNFLDLNLPLFASVDHSTIAARPLLKEIVDTAARSSKEAGYKINVTLLSCIDRREECSFEDIGEFLEQGSAPGIVHEPHRSIPNHRRIPHHMANNWTYIREQRNVLPDDGSRSALYDYNPVLFPLYQNNENGTLATDLHSDLLDRLTGRYHPYFSDADADRVKYLAISRITNVHLCGPHSPPNMANKKKRIPT